MAANVRESYSFPLRRWMACERGSSTRPWLCSGAAYHDFGRQEQHCIRHFSLQLCQQQPAGLNTLLEMRLMNCGKSRCRLRCFRNIVKPNHSIQQSLGFSHEKVLKTA